MTRIALCDNELTVLEELHLLLKRYSARRDQDLETAGFDSPLEPVAAMERGAGFDVLPAHLASCRCVLRVHRSCFVNMDCIQRLSCRAIVPSRGAEIPIPRGRYPERKMPFLEYAAGKGRVLL